MQKNRGTFDSVRRCFDECFDWVDELFPDFGSCELHEDTAAGSDNGAGADRQYAYCKNSKPMIIAFAPKARQLTMSNLRGLMRHEFGHALEYRYGVAELERRLGKLPETVERRADVIAERVWGDPIVYDERLVQCVGKNGTHPRPKHLPDRKEKLKANGGDLVVAYHGARRAMEKPESFDVPKTFDWGPGFYLSTSPADSIGYGSHLYETRVRMKNPIVVDDGDPDPALLSWLQRAIRISDDDLAFYENKMAGIFELYQTAVQIGQYKPMALADALKKKGYDGIVVLRDAILQKDPDSNPHGDFLVVWDPDQLEGWTEVSQQSARKAYDERWSVTRNGAPMELWHASPVPDLDRRGFDPSLGSEFGIYLTPRRRYAMNYGPYLYRVTARFSNPVIVWGKGQISPADLTEEDVDALREQGYDSIVVSDTETMKDASEVVLFDNDQVVSIERVH